MIEINLAKRKTASHVAEGGASALGVDRIRAMFNRSGVASSATGALSDWPVRSIILSLVVFYGSQFTFESLKTEDLSAIDKRIESQRKKRAEIQSKLSQDAKLQEQRTELFANEKLIKTKLDTISQLVQARQTAVNTFREISGAIPTEVWLQSIIFSETQVDLSGQSLDYNQISDFMNRISQSQFLSEPNLENSAQIKDESGLNSTSFRLTAKRK
ncbi:MAG: PilN domain-containing protein [Bdellovibrionales bacterium]|nr:PilN domain-containing protein [Bdellovibrionales bacterium]